MAAAARDISQASLSRDNLTAVAARSVPATVTRPQQPLPTPPNSISPNLPPHGLKAQLQKAKLEPIDSDLDLHEPSDRRRSISPGLEASGAITGSLLAKYHLPEILLNHGPLAIRHIMGYLTTSVPGFSGIPPTKARRLVVGWGRWDARKRGQPSRHRQGTPPSSYGAGIPIGNNGAQTDHGFRSSSAYAPGGLRSFSASSGMARPPQTLNIDFSALAGTSDAQEREAVEALLQLGSV
ncbi:hypothetical protein AU210_006677 [Fusarium oxysporum f. sp. radicis-cucumerinum]|uniref:Uncharacterized protein n=1 Tax=Fusarium oxysporum f. sp. radicis-cucumerinum TaxID=327505 RepID=A0A2H3HHB0_FUSOX|nr:hypothetical protein AU210_006677 [Fusarium oxysporum f. sp. radicis-cucumerinum]